MIFKFNLWNTPFLQMVEIVKGHYFHHTDEKLDGKNTWIFYRISHNTGNFIMQKINSF